MSSLNEKLQKSIGCLKRSFAAPVGVEESRLTVETRSAREDLLYDI